MKVAFVIPIAFERFFHDAKSLFSDPIKFEDEIISKRNTWHFNWCRALLCADIDVTLYHLSLYGKQVRKYEHYTGVKIKRIPTNWRGSKPTSNEYSFTLLKELHKDNPDVVFSVVHILSAVVDMNDILAFYCKIKNYRLVTRNPQANSYDLIFDRLINSKKKYNLTRNNKLSKKLLLLLKLIYNGFVSNLKFLIKKQSFKFTDLIIPQTKIDYENLVNKFGVENNKLKFLPKPVDTNNFFEIPKEIAAQKLNMDNNVKYIFHSSNLVDTKGCEHVINILPKLALLFPGIKLLVSGNGRMRKELEELAYKKNVKNSVIFLGHIEHSFLVYYYNLADAFVLPTKILNEGQPNVILEAIASNTVPISSDLPGPKEIIGDKLGITVEVGNENDLFEAIKKVLEGKFVIDKDKRIEFLKMYALKNVGNNLKKLFETL